MKFFEYLLAAIRGATNAIIGINKDSNSGNNPKISRKNRLVISNSIDSFIFDNINFIQTDFAAVINEKLAYLSYIKKTPSDFDQYINDEFNKWLKLNIFLKKNNFTKKTKKIIDKYWRQKNLTFILTNQIKILGFKRY